MVIEVHKGEYVSTSVSNKAGWTAVKYFSAAHKHTHTNSYSTVFKLQLYPVIVLCNCIK